MKKIILLLLILLLVSSCAKKPDSPDPTVKDNAPLATAGSDSQKTIKEYAFAAQYIRLYRSETLSGEIEDGLTVVRSREELDAFGQGKFDRDFDTLEYTVGQASFNTLTQKYDDEYFKSKHLIICTVTEPSGSNRHEVEKVTDEAVYINRILPDGGTDDMAKWAIIVETKQFDAYDLDIYIDGENTTGTPATVKVYGGITSLSVHLPEGWEYQENNFVSEENEYGIYFFPEGEEGRLYLSYQNAMGICGTGLETQKITVAGYECSEMTWDGKEYWDIISFPVDYGSVTVTNTGAQWLVDREDEVMDILDSIRIETPTLTAERAKELAAAYYGGEYDGNILSSYNLMPDTYTVTFRKDGTEYAYTVYPTETVKSENLDARKMELDSKK